MQQEVYEICSKPLGQGKIAQVYKIKKMDIPHNILIAKIYQKKRIIYYEKEKKILLRISNENNDGQNDYLIHLKEANAALTPSDEFSEDSELLTFDFLMHGNVVDYVSLKNIGKPFCELYVKLLCYKILLGLKKCHENRISHNRLEIRNIMFDENFNPIIIHFGDAKISDNHRKDFIGLANIITGLLTSRKIIKCKLDKITNKYIYKFYSNLNSLNKENCCDESTFWTLIDDSKGIKISEEFMDFFHELISPDKIVNIDDLLHSAWLKEVIFNRNEIENILKAEFKHNYYMLKESQELISNYNHQINLSSIINKDEMAEALTQNNIAEEFIKNMNKLDEKR